MKQKRPPFPLILPGLRMLVRFPLIAAIPPSDERRKIQVLRLHQQVDLRQWPMNVQIRRKPTFASKVGNAFQGQSHQLRRLVADGDFPLQPFVFRATLDLVTVAANRQLKLGRSRAYEVIAPKRQASSPLRFAIGIKQMDPTRQRLAVFILNIKAKPSGMGIEGYHHVEQSKHV